MAKEFLPDAKPPPKKRGGKSPQQAGRRIERVIATKLGEKPTVGSGAFKSSNKNLTGDVDVRDNEGKDYVKLEIKMTGAVNAAGDKVYALQEKVLKQMEEEAHANRELGALVIHYKNGKQYVVMPFADWMSMLEDAKLGRTARL
jgi:hypothetical protein